MEFFKAEKIANRIIEIFTPHVDLIHIAGSVRRRKPEVKDIEIVCLPKKASTELFGQGEIKTIAEFRNDITLIAAEVIKGNADGRYMQLLLKGKEIKLDLFMPQPDDYYRQFAIRTGSADYSKRMIADTWVAMGWCGAEHGLRKQSDCCKAASGWKVIKTDGEKPPVWQSEQEFFDWLGIQWIEPWLRNV